MALILIDLDDTSAFWYAHFRGRMTVRFPKFAVPTLEELTAYAVMVGDPEHDAAARAIMDEPGFYLALDPIPGAIEAHHEMLDAGHDVFLCSTPTDSNPTCADDKTAWVKRYYGREWAARLILTHDKTLVHGDVLFDDKPDITGVRAPSWRQVYFTQPYNRHLPGPRLDDWGLWEEVLEAALGQPAAA